MSSGPRFPALLDLAHPNSLAVISLGWIGGWTSSSGILGSAGVLPANLGTERFATTPGRPRFSKNSAELGSTGI